MLSFDKIICSLKITVEIKMLKVEFNYLIEIINTLSIVSLIKYTVLKLKSTSDFWTEQKVFLF